MAVLAWAGLALSLFAPEAILLLGGPTYLEAAKVVPLVVTAFILAGAYSFLNMGPALKKSSTEMVVATLWGLGTSLAASVLLIPRLGLWGAAIAALASALVLAIVMLRASQRCYPVSYPWGAVLRLAVLSSRVDGRGVALAGPTIGSAVWRALLLLSFPLQLRALLGPRDRGIPVVAPAAPRAAGASLGGRVKPRVRALARPVRAGRGLRLFPSPLPDGVCRRAGRSTERPASGARGECLGRAGTSRATRSSGACRSSTSGSSATTWRGASTTSTLATPALQPAGGGRASLDQRLRAGAISG